jgi:putative Holliday junction resolvase
MNRMESGKCILAVDYGSKNIGLACSDDLGLTVRPLPSTPNSGKKNLIRELRTLIDTLGVQELVLGMPLNMDGTRGDPLVRMEQLLESLKRALKIPATGMDERLSTEEALEIWQSLSPRRQKKYRTVDSLAAALILERYLKES